MKPLWIIGFIVFYLSDASFSQVKHEGVPFNDFYPINAYGLPQEAWCINEDYRGFIYVASNKGLLEYDGREWRTYSTDNNSVVRTVCAQPSGRIYAGAVQTFGYFEPDSRGVLTYHSLCPLIGTQELEFSDVWQVRECNSFIYFESMLKIFRYNPSDNSLVTIDAETEFQLTGCIRNELYVGQGSIGLCKIVNDKAVLVPGGEFFKNEIIYNILPYDADNILVSGKFNIYIFNLTKGELNKEYTDLFNRNLSLKDERFYIIFKVRGGQYGISTLNEGVFIVNKDGSVHNHFSIDNILPSNVSFYGMEARNGNIWIGLDIGVMKVENASPFSKLEYNRKNTLIINSITHIGESLYYNSNLGVFSKKTNNENNWKSCRPTHIEGTNFRCFDLSFYLDPFKKDTSLLIAGEDGLFISKNNKLKQITKRIVFSRALQSKLDPSIIYLSTNKGLAVLKYPSHKFSDIRYITQVKSAVFKIIEDDIGNIWVSTSTDGFYYIERTKDYFKVLYHFKQTGERSNIEFAFRNNDNILFIYKNNLWTFNLKNYQVSNSKGLLPEYLQKKGVSAFVHYRDSTFWYFYLNENVPTPCQVIGKTFPNYNSIFRRLKDQGVQTVFQESNDKVWFGSTSGIICSQNFAESNLYKQKPLIFIRSVKVNNDSLIYNGSGDEGSYQFRLNENTASINQGLAYSANEISVTVTMPYLVSESSNQYSYFLQGYGKGWSEWTSSNSCEYKNLQEGNYRLLVKGRNIFGIESSTLEINFEVLAPWYRTLYSYFGGLVLFTILIIYINYKVQKRHRDERYKLENIISQRTSEIINQKSKIESQTKLLDISNKSLQQLSIVAEETDNPVIITNTKGEIEWVNKSFYRYYDYEIRNDLKVKFSELCVNADIEEKINTCINKKIPISYSGQFDTSLNKEVWFQITINPIRDGRGKVVNVIIVCSDITDVIELNKTRDLIISVITHDIKSPLLGFKMMAKSLSDNIAKIEKKKLHEWVNSMHDNSSDIYELVENLTKWFKSQRGMLSFVLTTLDLYKIVNDVFSIFEPQATTKGIRLVNFVKEGTTVLADENMIRTILRNLLSNAIKFSEMGIVCISSEYVDDEIVISVSDEGIGIDDQTKAKILSNDYNESIGLLICKEFLQKNGGRLAIDSNHEGTTISFSLPQYFKHKEL